MSELPGIGPKRARILAEAGIRTLGDLVRHFPRDYEDRRRCTPIAEAAAGARVTILATVERARVLRMRRGLTATEARLRDDSGAIRALWFGRGFLARALPAGATGYFTGVIDERRGRVLQSPDYEPCTEDGEDGGLSSGRIVPIYRLTEGLSQRALRGWIAEALQRVAPRDGDSAPESLPTFLRERHGYPSGPAALWSAHFPDTPEAARAARDRFVYEELLALQLGILSARTERDLQETGHAHDWSGPRLAALRAALPFELTEAQTRAIADIAADMTASRPMLRLLQGDVGCGKTVVAAHAMAAAADGGFQTALMAPTEILAGQHALSLGRLLAPAGLRVALLTGGLQGAAAVRAQIAAGEADVVVGTHALIQGRADFHRLGLVVIDEQHRFGVLQREALAGKGACPDVLHMTATPIPRTLAITVYGGMDLSLIDELPPGRLPVKTSRVSAAKTPDLYAYLREQAAAGRQAYYVCPLVDESDVKELAAATRHYEELRAGPLADLRLGLLHGRLSPAEKEAIMTAFRDGAIDVLVATTVIEVGVDCPRATTMVIEDAAQFGLTQLHQLRGRVGRGADQAHCFLLGEPATPEGAERLKTMCATTNGFEIAEADLRLRGPGEFRGVRQAGLTDLRTADLVRDARLLETARRDARELLSRYGALQEMAQADPEFRPLVAAAHRFSRLLV